MKPADPHSQEELRLKALNEYEILDTLPEQEFDDLTMLASEICDTPIALFSLVDQSRQWFKSKLGLDADETHRDLAFCAHAINEKDVFYIEDASKDIRFADNPLVIGWPDIRFYAGTQILSHDGLPLGTLCVIDKKPRKLTGDQKSALKAIGRQVMSQLELRRMIKNERNIKKHLSQANQKLNQLAKFKTDYLNQISHEVRTPLNGILGLSSSLTSRYPIKQDSELGSLESEIDMIHRAAFNLREMVTHILDISRIESGKMKITNEPINLEQLVDDVVKVVFSRAREKNIKINSSISVDEFIVLDRTKIFQILMNLIGNAIKFSPSDSEVSIDVAVKNRMLCIEISDQGQGISSQELELIFEPFKQSERNKNNDQLGSGLGLTIVKELTHLLGGSIDVESELNRGSTFFLKFPYKPDRQTQKKAILVEEPPALENKKIVLVEDNPVNRLVFKGFIQPTNADLILIANATESLVVIENEMPDLIFLDIRMPDMSGYEVLDCLRKNSKVNHIPVAFLSGDVTHDSQKKAKDLGVDFLAKPLLKSELYNFLQEKLLRE